MGNQSLGVFQYRFQKSMGFKFLYRVEKGHGRVAADDLMDELSIIAEAVPVWNQNKGVFPAH
jgi:hypothetical protein